MRRLLTESSVPTVVALRERLDEVCRQEVENYREDAGPFSVEQEQVMNGLAKRISARIAGSLARELKDRPEATDQDQLTAAIQKLFHLKRGSGAAVN